MGNLILGSIMMGLLVFVLVIIVWGFIKIQETEILVGRIYALIAHLPDIKNTNDLHESTMIGLQKILNSLDDQCGSRSHRILYGKITEIHDLLDRNLTSNKIKKTEKFLSKLQDVRKKSK